MFFEANSSIHQLAHPGIVGAIGQRRRWLVMGAEPVVPDTSGYATKKVAAPVG
jgi:hypothetical protein